MDGWVCWVSSLFACFLHLLLIVLSRTWTKKQELRLGQGDEGDNNDADNDDDEHDDCVEVSLDTWTSSTCSMLI